MTIETFATTTNAVSIFLVLSFVIEITLTPIFNWRVYLRRFNGATYIHPLTLAATYLLLKQYSMDPTEMLFDAFAPNFVDGTGSTLISAFLIMFGSEGVFRFLSWSGVQSQSRRIQRAQAAQIDRRTRSSTESIDTFERKT